MILSSMPFTRKWKAKEKRSRLTDVMSGLENVGIMRGSYSNNDERIDQDESDVNVDSESYSLLRSSNLVGEVFRSLLNTNRTVNSEMTKETTEMISEEITNQVTRRLT